MSTIIPLWIISYSDSDTMRVLPEDIAVLAEAEGRSVEIMRFPFRQSSTKKLEVPKTYNECLIVCRGGARHRLSITVPPTIEVMSSLGDGRLSSTATTITQMASRS